MNKSANRIRKALQYIIILCAGNALLAFLVAAFIIPHDIIMGGATGIGIVLGSLLSLDTAAIVLGKTFLISTAASSFLYPFFLAIMERIPEIRNLTQNTLMASLFAGGLMGLALGMLLRIGSSTGGTDVLNLVAHKWFHIPVSVAIYITDLIILGGQVVFSDTEHILYGIIVVVVEAVVLDQVMVMGESQLQLFIVSEKFEELRRGFLRELNAGVTMMFIETGCRGKEQKGVLCVIPKHRLHGAMALIQSIDESAFITVTQIKEVRGEGFTRERKPLEQRNDL